MPCAAAVSLHIIDSSGVHVIVTESKNAERDGRRLMVVPGPVVEHMVALSGVNGLISTFDLAPTEPACELHLV